MPSWNEPNTGLSGLRDIRERVGHLYQLNLIADLIRESEVIENLVSCKNLKAKVWLTLRFVLIKNSSYRYLSFYTILDFTTRHKTVVYEA